MKNNGKILALFFGGILLIWQGYAWHLGKSSLLPSPLAVCARCISQWDRLSFHSLATFKTMGMALCFAVLFALPCGWTMAKKPWTRSIVQAFFILFQCLPMFTLAPLMILWFGWSHIAVLVPTTLMLLFPLIINFYKGISATPKEHLEFFQAHQATEWQIFILLRLPYAVPYVFSGLRICISFAGIGAIAGEWAGAQNGLGVFLQESRRNFDMEGLFAGLVCLLILTSSFYGVLHLLERRLARWHRYATN